MKWQLCSNDLDRQFVFMDQNSIIVVYPAITRSQQSANWANKTLRAMDLWKSVASPEEQVNAQIIISAPQMFEQLRKTHRFLRKFGYDMTEIDALINRIEKAAT